MLEGAAVEVKDAGDEARLLARRDADGCDGGDEARDVLHVCGRGANTLVRESDRTVSRTGVGA